jgi:signal peptidase I
VFRYPQDETRDFIKRIVGMPGEAVQIRGKTVLINGRSLNEPYTYFQPGDVPSGQ